MRGQDTLVQHRTNFLILMTRVSQASPQRNKLDACFRIIGQFYALQVSYWKSELWKALSWLYLLLPLIELFVFEMFNLLSTSNWKRAKKLAKTGLWVSFRYFHYHLVVIGIQVFFLPLSLSLLFLLHGEFSLKAKIFKSLVSLCDAASPTTHLFTDLCTSLLD